MLERIHLEERQVRGLDDTTRLGCSTVATEVCVLILVRDDGAFIIGLVVGVVIVRNRVETFASCTDNQLDGNFMTFRKYGESYQDERDKAL